MAPKGCNFIAPLTLIQQLLAALFFHLHHPKHCRRCGSVYIFFQNSSSMYLMFPLAESYQYLAPASPLLQKIKMAVGKKGCLLTRISFLSFLGLLIILQSLFLLLSNNAIIYDIESGGQPDCDTHQVLAKKIDVMNLVLQFYILYLVFHFVLHYFFALFYVNIINKGKNKLAQNEK